ncbi:MAG TPA: SRPBCC family protein [Solirubrobacteraceae bacterium]|jgi:uncharacterized protein YndB with AHSA1/START domain|nr:SRPBCC family protein [Solirubrobacteraceae bacterium]
MTDDGVLVRTGEKAVLRFERRLSHPVERVWAAITDPDELGRWWGDVTTGLAPGGEFTVAWRNAGPDGSRVVMRATITELDPPRTLEIRGDPHGTLRFELSEAGGGTLLTFTSTLALPDEHRSRVLAGWHYHLDALATALDGGATELVDLPNPEWERLHARYAS